MGTKDKQLAIAFGAKLRELRLAAGLTQEQLGAATSPSMQSQAIVRYESGDRGPTLAVIYRLAAALKVDPCDLLPTLPAKKKGK
jgi:transcriptional regulator with XRE-family HTH domain